MADPPGPMTRWLVRRLAKMDVHVHPRVAPLAEHAPQKRNSLLPRDFTLPRIEDEDC